VANSGQSLQERSPSAGLSISAALPEQSAIRRQSQQRLDRLKAPAGNHAMPDEIRTYAALQQQMHYALREQHPEWVEPDGDSPICESYERRFAELLALFSTSGTRSLQTLND
jgi:hypothetical protein